MNALRWYRVLLGGLVLVVLAAGGAALATGWPFGSPLTAGFAGCVRPIVAAHFSETTLAQFTDAVRKGEVSEMSVEGENLWYQDAHSFVGHHACLPRGKSINQVLNGAGIPPDQFPPSRTPE